MDIRVRVKADSPYFTSSLYINFDSSENESFKFGIKNGVKYYSKNATFIGQEIIFNGQEYNIFNCSRDSEFILLSRNIFTGSDVDFPLVRSKLNISFLLKDFKGGLVLIEIILPRKWKARFGHYDNPLSYIEIRNAKQNRRISLNYDPGKLEYGNDINIYRFYPYISPGNSEIEINLLITPYWKLIFLRFIPWIQTAATLFLSSPLFDLSTHEISIAYLSLYSGYLAFLLGSEAPLFSSMEVHWIIILTILTSFYVLLRYILPPPAYLLALSGYLALLILSLFEIVKFYFKGELSHWFRKIYSKIPHGIVVKLLKIFTEPK